MSGGGFNMPSAPGYQAAPPYPPMEQQGYQAAPPYPPMEQQGYQPSPYPPMDQQPGSHMMQPLNQVCLPSSRDNLPNIFFPLFSPWRLMELSSQSQ